MCDAMDAIDVNKISSWAFTGLISFISCSLNVRSRMRLLLRERDILLAGSEDDPIVSELGALSEGHKMTSLNDLTNYI